MEAMADIHGCVMHIFQKFFQEYHQESSSNILGPY